MRLITNIYNNTFTVLYVLHTQHGKRLHLQNNEWSHSIVVNVYTEGILVRVITYMEIVKENLENGINTGYKNWSYRLLREDANQHQIFILSSVVVCDNTRNGLCDV